MSLALSRRIDCARILCVFGIVYSHVMGPWRFGYEASPRAEFLYFFVSDSIFHAGVPMLSIVSGFLLFRVFENSDYVRILKKKAGTLLLPAFLWSLLTAAPAFLLQYLGVTDGDVVHLYPPVAADWFNAVAPFGAKPLNAPLFFIYDLYKCVVLAPVFLFFKHRARWLLLGVLVVAYFAKVDHFTGTRTDIVLGFYIGCLLVGHGASLGRLDRYAVPIGVMFLAACLADTLVSMSDPFVGTPLERENRFLLVRVFGPPAFWLLAGRLSVSRISDLLVKLAPLTFFIYCFHGPFMKTMSRLYYKFIYTGFPGEFEVFFVASGAVTILAAIVSAKVLMRVWPYGMSILSGRRLGRAPAVRTADESLELTPAIGVGALGDGTTGGDGRRG